MATKTQRIEMRADPDSEARIAQAARLSSQTVSAFVLDAANAAADRMITRVHHVIMPNDQFDELISSLDQADEAPALERVARRRQRFVRR
ncbi:DUF1778 domain-containing protein [Micromonospora sp. DT233]|uniref:type II toxin-antitoxin system TacA family antitoxin n=1 Tax=Micromonospora sp. DT233 TaxID=3393432 RepID=UPI003CF65A23